MFGQKPPLSRWLLRGAIAGAAGTTTLNIITYSDMLLRGRGSSGVPAKVAGTMADALGVDALRPDNESDEASNRRSGAGALMGYVSGIGTGVLFGMIRRKTGPVNPLAAGVGVGLAAMLASDAPIVLSGACDPREWGASATLSDLIPHLAYGTATAAVMESMSR